MQSIYLQQNKAATLAETHNLQTGDIIVREKVFGAEHHAVFSHYENGEAILAENQWGIGTTQISLEKFLEGGEFLRVKKFEGDIEPVKQRLKELVGNKNYSLFFYNCEHFVNHVTGRKVESKQVNFVKEAVVAIVIAALFLAAIFSLARLAKRA